MTWGRTALGPGGEQAGRAGRDPRHPGLATPAGRAGKAAWAALEVEGSGCWARRREGLGWRDSWPQPLGRWRAPGKGEEDPENRLGVGRTKSSLLSASLSLLVRGRLRSPPAPPSQAVKAGREGRGGCLSKAGSAQAAAGLHVQRGLILMLRFMNILFFTRLCSLRAMGRLKLPSTAPWW